MRGGEDSKAIKSLNSSTKPAHRHNIIEVLIVDKETKEKIYYIEVKEEIYKRMIKEFSEKIKNLRKQKVELFKKEYE